MTASVQIVNQLALTTTLQTVDLGPGRTISAMLASNSDLSATTHVIVYTVPKVRSSTLKSEHILWYTDVAAKYTSIFDLQKHSLFIGEEFTVQALAENNLDITLTVLGT